MWDTSKHILHLREIFQLKTMLAISILRLAKTRLCLSVKVFECFFPFFRICGTWDLRNLKSKGNNQPISHYKASKTGNSAFFSPGTGNKILYTAYDNYVRLLFSLTYPDLSGIFFDLSSPVRYFLMTYTDLSGIF